MHRSADSSATISKTFYWLNNVKDAFELAICHANRSINTLQLFQIIDEAVCISHGANALERGMNQTILPLEMGKYFIRQGSLTLVWLPVWEKENSEFIPVKLRLKTDLVMEEGFGKYIP